jgi:hypothetical protein
VQSYRFFTGCLTHDRTKTGKYHFPSHCDKSLIKPTRRNARQGRNIICKDDAKERSSPHGSQEVESKGKEGIGDQKHPSKHSY